MSPHDMPSTSLVSHSLEQERHQNLMRRVAENHDRDAFRALFLYFAPRIKALMLKSGTNNAVVEDLVQDVMMMIWHKSALYSPNRGSVSAWIYTVARNIRIDQLRRKSTLSSGTLENLELASLEESSEDIIYTAQLCKCVRLALHNLPDDQLHIIQLSYIHNMTQSEIAKHLSLPLGTVKSRMRLAYGKLKAILQDLK